MLNSIEPKEFSRLLEQTKAQLATYPHIDPNDVFNDVIVRALEDERELCFGDLQKLLYAEVKLVGNGRKGALNPRKSYKYTKSFVCAACQDQLPASAFYFVDRKKTGQKEALSYCIECHRKYVAEYCKKMAKDPRRIYAVKKAQRKYEQKRKNANTSEYRMNARERAKKYLSNPENLEKQRQRARDYYQKVRSSKSSQIQGLIN